MGKKSITGFRKSEKIRKLEQSRKSDNGESKRKYEKENYYRLQVIFYKQEENLLREYASRYQTETGEFLTKGHSRAGSMSAFAKRLILEGIERIRDRERETPSFRTRTSDD